MQRSRKKENVKRGEEGENEKTKKKRKSSRKTRKTEIQSRTVYKEYCSFFRHGIQGQVFHLIRQPTRHLQNSKIDTFRFSLLISTQQHQ
jgi:hypothetical protein